MKLDIPGPNKNNVLLLANNFDNRDHDGVGRYASELHNELSKIPQRHEIISIDDLSRYKNIYMRSIDIRNKVKRTMRKIEDLGIVHLTKPEAILSVPTFIPHHPALIVSWHDLIRLNNFRYVQAPQNRTISNRPNHFISYFVFMKEYVRAYKISSHILAVSELTKTEIDNWAKKNNIFDHKKNIVVINPGINRKYIESEPHDGYRKDFIYLGSIHKAPKLLSTFFRIRSILPDQKLHIYTQTEGADKIILEELKRNDWISMLADIRIHFNRSDDEIIDKLKRSLALLHIVGIEGFGSPIIESLALGTPVIIPKEAKISNEVSRFTFKLDYDEIPIFCEQLYHSQKSLPKEAISYAKSFSYEKAAQSVISIYEKYL